MIQIRNSCAQTLKLYWILTHQTPHTTQNPLLLYFYSSHDLDNLVLDKIPERSATAVFELEALMLTGTPPFPSTPPQH